MQLLLNLFFPQVLVLSMTLCSVSLSQQLTRSEESPDAETCKGKQGIPGEAGYYGYPGDKGEKGQPASSLTRPPPGTPCLCPPGPEGSEGPIGEPGPQGMKGLKGLKGYPGGKGDVGSRGSPGFPGPPGSLQSPHPPSKPDTMYVPVVIKKKLPPVICHHFRRHSYGKRELFQNHPQRYMHEQKFFHDNLTLPKSTEKY